MRYRGMIGASAACVAAMAGAALVTKGRLPPGTQLPTHWNAAGNADRFADAATALWMPVVAAAIASGVMAAIPYLEPLQERMAKSRELYRVAWGGVLGVMVVAQAMIAAPAWGVTVPASLMLVAIGLLLVAIGNVLPKSRPGFFVGIRTPWTLTDTDNWIATHRLGGRLMVAGGLILAVAGVAPLDPNVRTGIVLLVVATIVAVPVLYSFLKWRAHTA